MKPFTISELLELFAPTTLAEVISDVDNLGKEATVKQLALEAACRDALIANVGDCEAAAMLRKLSVTT